MFTLNRFEPVIYVFGMDEMERKRCIDITIPYTVYYEDHTRGQLVRYLLCKVRIHCAIVLGCYAVIYFVEVGSKWRFREQMSGRFKYI